MTTTLLAGLVSGSIYAIIAIGYNMTLTTAGVLNFAFANIVILGAFVTISGLQLGLGIAALLLAAIVCALVAVIEERVAIRFLPSGSSAELITTLGAATILSGLTVLIWGVDPLGVDLFPQSPIDILGGKALPSGLMIIVIAVVLGLLLSAFNRFTKLGIASRAHASNREATMLRGVDVRWLSMGAFAATGVVAGLVGPVIAMSTSASPYVALSLAIKGFVVLTIGGIGSQVGAILGGYVIGIAEALAALLLGSLYSDFVVFAIFLAVLLLRPQGLFGHRTLRLV